MPDQYINAGLRTITSQTVASLGSATLSPVGHRAIVNDSTVNYQVSRGLTAVGGGTYQAVVRSNGTVWKIA